MRDLCVQGQGSYINPCFQDNRICVCKENQNMELSEFLNKLSVYLGQPQEQGILF